MESCVEVMPSPCLIDFSLKGSNVLPNPSLERTSTGLALGPRAVQCHHPSRGPSANPASARSAQTLGSGARQKLEPPKYSEPGAHERQKLERRAQRGGAEQSRFRSTGSSFA